MKLPALCTIERFLTELDDSAIRYVHWKSNINVAKALAGVDDLDLLVHPNDIDACRAVLSSHQFIRGISDVDHWHRGMWHFYRPDLGARRMVHVHLHDRLILGFDADKNYTLPIVDWYLQDARQVEVMKVPMIERELIVFLLRTYLKHARSTKIAQLPRGLRRLLLNARPELSRSEVAELEFLSTQSDPDETQRVLDSSGLNLDYHEFRDLLAQALNEPSTWQVFGASSLVKRSLSAHRTRSELSSLSHAGGRITSGRVKALLKRAGLNTAHKRRSSLGGRIFALVGGDGAGKSTNVEALRQLLGQSLWTEAIHVGRPSRTPLGLLLRALSRALDQLQAPRIAASLDHLSLALNRLGAFRRAERLRKCGGFAVLDRLPMSAISMMDAPRIAVTEDDSKLIRAVGGLEQKIYDRIRGVDLLVVLKLDPNIALQRRAEDNPEVLLQRSGEVWRQNWPEPYMFAVDSGRHTVTEVLEKVSERAWKEATTPFARTELLGLSGSGKSTVSRGLSRKISNSQRTLPYWRNPLTLGRCTLKQIIARPPRSLLDLAVFKNIVQLRWFIELHEELADPRGLGATNYILDQGPVFQLSIGIVEELIRPDSKLYSSAVRAINSWTAGEVPWLQLPDHVCEERLDGRGGSTRSVTLDNREKIELARRYRQALDLIERDIVRIVRVDADRQPEDVVSDVYTRIRTHRRQ